MGPQPGVQEADQDRLAHPVVGADKGVVMGEMAGLAADGKVLGYVVKGPGSADLKGSCRNLHEIDPRGRLRRGPGTPLPQTGWGWPGAAPRRTGGRPGYR